MGKGKTISGLKVIAVALLLSFMAACEEEKTNLVYELKQPDDLEEEVYEVYSTLINNHFNKLEYVVIQQETDSSVIPRHSYNLYESQNTDVDSSIIENYLQKNNDSYNLDYKFQTNVEVKLITMEEFESYEGWESFHSNHPEATGVIFFTYPGFNEDYTKALYEYSWHTGDDSAESYIVYLKKSEKEWYIAAREPTTDAQ